MCVGKFQRTSAKNHSCLSRAGRLVILASPRKEFATARAGAALSFCPLSLAVKKVDKQISRREKVRLDAFAAKESGNQLNERLDKVFEYYKIPISTRT